VAPLVLKGVSLAFMWFSSLDATAHGGVRHIEVVSGIQSKVSSSEVFKCG
jgi:hypothetical protein